MKRLLQHWLPPLIWMGIIFLFSAQPTLPHAPGPWFDLILKKMGHAFAYGILAGLYFWTLRGRIESLDILRVVSVGLALAYALSDEYHQTFVPGRNGSWADVAVDGLGAGGAMLLSRWWGIRRKRSPGVSQ